MKCYICDKQLSDKNIVWNAELHQYEPCPQCLEVALDAAYSGGFRRNEDNVEDYVSDPDEGLLDLDAVDIDNLSDEVPHGRRLYDPASGGAVGFFDE